MLTQPKRVTPIKLEPMSKNSALEAVMLGTNIKLDQYLEDQTEEFSFRYLAADSLKLDPIIEHHPLATLAHQEKYKSSLLGFTEQTSTQQTSTQQTLGTGRKYLYTTAADHQHVLSVFDLDTQRTTQLGILERSFDTLFVPEQNCLICGSYDYRRIKVIDMDKLEEVFISTKRIKHFTSTGIESFSDALHLRGHHLYYVQNTVENAWTIAVLNLKTKVESEVKCDRLGLKLANILIKKDYLYVLDSLGIVSRVPFASKCSTTSTHDVNGNELLNLAGLQQTFLCLYAKTMHSNYTKEGNLYEKFQHLDKYDFFRIKLAGRYVLVCARLHVYVLIQTRAEMRLVEVVTYPDPPTPTRPSSMPFGINNFSVVSVRSRGFTCLVYSFTNGDEFTVCNIKPGKSASYLHTSEIGQTKDLDPISMEKSQVLSILAKVKLPETSTILSFKHFTSEDSLLCVSVRSKKANPPEPAEGEPVQPKTEPPSPSACPPLFLFRIVLT